MVFDSIEAPEFAAGVGIYLPRAGRGDVLAGRVNAQFLGLFLACDGSAGPSQVAHHLVCHLRDPGHAGVQFDGEIINEFLRAAGIAQPEVADDGGPGEEGALVELLIGPEDVFHRHQSIPFVELDVIPDLDGPDEEIVGYAPFSGQ